jgi:glutamate N-acetyltransferase/amino-acid N-acetyltransferase
MRLDPAREERLVASLRAAELYRSMPSPDGAFRPPVDFPPHERSVEVEVELGLGAAGAEVLGADLTHEYVTENADYRS